MKDLCVPGVQPTEFEPRLEKQKRKGESEGIIHIEVLACSKSKEKDLFTAMHYFIQAVTVYMTHILKVV